jgi:hypothetical protein
MNYEPITMTGLSKVRIVFDHTNTGFMGSNEPWLFVRAFLCVCVS